MHVRLWCLDGWAKLEDERPTRTAPEHIERQLVVEKPKSSMEQENVRGAVITVLGMGAFIMTDAFSKYAVTELQLPILQVLSLRGFGMVLFLSLLIGIGSDMWSLTRSDALLLLGRVVLEVLGSWCFNLGLVHLPMSLATAIVQVCPR